MTRKRMKRTSKTGDGFAPTLGCLDCQWAGFQKKSSNSLISIPRELRERILFESLDQSFLEKKTSLVERAGELSTICTVIRDDMAWVREQWLRGWRKLHERDQLKREAANKSFAQMADYLRQQAIPIPKSNGARPCRRCRQNWKWRKWEGLKPLCRSCVRRGIRLSKGSGKPDLRW